MLLPSAAQSQVEGNSVGLILAPDLHEQDLSIEQLAFGIQVIQIAGEPAAITEIGKFDSLPKALDKALLLISQLGKFSARNQGVCNLSKGLLHRLSVKKFRLPLLRVGAQHTGTDATLVEDGHTDRGANRPRAAETADQIMQGGTFKPRRRCQRDRGEERRLGHGYEGVTGDELLLCLADVRPAVEQSRWQARRERRSLLLLQLHSTANDGAGVSTEQDIKLVLGLLDLHFQTGERRAGSFHKHLGLARIQFGGVAVVYAKLNQRERVVADLKSLPSDSSS